MGLVTFGGGTGNISRSGREISEIASVVGWSGVICTRQIRLGSQFGTGRMDEAGRDGPLDRLFS